LKEYHVLNVKTPGVTRLAWWMDGYNSANQMR